MVKESDYGNLKLLFFSKEEPVNLTSYSFWLSLSTSILFRRYRYKKTMIKYRAETRNISMSSLMSNRIVDINTYVSRQAWYNMLYYIRHKHEQKHYYIMHLFTFYTFCSDLWANLPEPWPKSLDLWQNKIAGLAKTMAGQCLVLRPWLLSR